MDGAPECEVRYEQSYGSRDSRPCLFSASSTALPRHIFPGHVFRYVIEYVGKQQTQTRHDARCSPHSSIKRVLRLEGDRARLV